MHALDFPVLRLPSLSMVVIVTPAHPGPHMFLERWAVVIFPHHNPADSWPVSAA
jgi:hypothetical protein